MTSEFTIDEAQDSHSGSDDGGKNGSQKNCCAAEFQLSNFGFSHRNPDKFVRSEWGFSIFYVIYRFVVAGYFFAILIYSGIVYKYGAKYLIYLTYWSYILLNVNTIYMFVTSVIGYYRFKKNQGEPAYHRMTWYLKISWILYNVSSQAAIVISILYWVFQYKESTVLTIVNITTHGVNSAYVFIDILITAIPIRILHAPATMIYGTLYLTFAPIYWAAGGLNEKGGEYIYGPLAYGDSLGLAIGISVGTVFIFVPLVQLVLFGLYKLRTLLHCGRKKTGVSAAPNPAEKRMISA